MSLRYPLEKTITRTFPETLREKSFDVTYPLEFQGHKLSLIGRFDYNEAETSIYITSKSKLFSYSLEVLFRNSEFLQGYILEGRTSRSEEFVTALKLPVTKFPVDIIIKIRNTFSSF